jgi:hypothetical protein
VPALPFAIKHFMEGQERLISAPYNQRFFFERFFAQKRYKFFLGEYLAIYWMKSLNCYQIQGGIALFWMKVHTFG